MYYIRLLPNKNGAYSPPQTSSAPNMVMIPDELIEEFINYKGFIIPVIENGIVVSLKANTEALEAWELEKSNMPVVIDPPTRVDILEAKIAYLAMMTNISLEE